MLDLFGEKITFQEMLYDHKKNMCRHYSAFTYVNEKNQNTRFNIE